MDKRKYLTKTLIAEFQSLNECLDSRYSEMAYKLKDGKIIIQFDGAKLSYYGLTIAFNKRIARKGIYSISNYDYDFWKQLRADDKAGYFIDWEQEAEDQLIADHENVLKLVNGDDLPF